MTTVAEIFDMLSELAPTDLAAKWDNVGLLVDAGVAPTSVLFALDITPEVVEEAAALNCHLIVSHHPVIFNPLRSITPKDVAFQLLSKKISAICMHTNLDAADGGVNDVLAKLIGLQNTIKFAEDCGRIGTVPQTTALAFGEACGRILGAKVKCIDTARPIARVAVVGGSGGSYVQEAASLGADLLLTGEAGHHDALDAKRLGLGLVVAGHYATEFPIVPVLSNRVHEAFPTLKCYISAKEMEPFDYL
ncbi:MAG: Nif3-like dinuclear metal center hexameric protein [Faecalibacterium sp.]